MVSSTPSSDDGAGRPSCLRRRRPTPARSSLRLALASDLSNAGAIHSHLSNDRDALDRYEEALKVRSTIDDEDENGAEEIELLQSRCEQTLTEVGRLSAEYKRIRKEESVSPTMDLYPASAALPAHPEVKDDQDEEDQHTPLAPLLIPCESDESISSEEDVERRDQAITLYNVALLHQSQGSHDEASKYFDMALSEVDSGSDDISSSKREHLFYSSVILRARALTEYKRGQLQASMDLLRECLQRHQILASEGEQDTKLRAYSADRLLTVEHIVADAFSLMGRIHYVVGNDAEAAEFAKEVLQLRERIASSSDQDAGAAAGASHHDHLALASSARNLGLIHALRSDYQSAASNLEEYICLVGEASSLCASTYAQSSSTLPLIAAAQFLIGLCHLEDHAVPRAVGSLRSAASLRAHLHGDDHPLVARTCLKLASVLHGVGRNGEAATVCEESLRCLQESRKDEEEQGSTTGSSSSAAADDATNTVLCRMLCLMGSIRSETGDLDGALQVYKEALRVARRQSSASSQEESEGQEASDKNNDCPHSILVANVLESIGHLRLVRGESQDAVTSFTDSANIRRRLAELGEDPTSDDGNDLSSSLKTTREFMQSFSAAAAA